jgi:hypothetical protein
MKRHLVIGALGAAFLTGMLQTEALAISPRVVAADALAGPSITTHVRYRRTAAVHHRHRHGVRYVRRSNAGAAIAAGTMLGLFGTLAAATPSYGYGDPYWYGDGYGYGYGYGYPYGQSAYYGYPGYGYGYGYPYRRAYYPRAYYPRGGYYRRAYYGGGGFGNRRAYYGGGGFGNRGAFYGGGGFGNRGAFYGGGGFGNRGGFARPVGAAPSWGHRRF